MNPENYRTKRQGQPKRTSAASKSKSSMLANAKVVTTYATPKLREIYATKAKWVANVIPKLKEP
jgi:hypothetical protein